MTSRQLRALRGTAAAAVAAWTAAVSHTLGGGAAPSPWLVLVVILLAAPVAVLLAGRSLGLVRLSLTVVLAQLLLHVTFALTAGLDPTSGGHVHGAVLPSGGAIGVTLDPVMVSAHLLAAIATILVIARGEWMLRAISRGIHRLLRFAAIIVRSPLPAPPLRAGRQTVALLARAAASVVSRRGPPSVVAAA
ncbi:hypothetical protein GCM10009775_28320 [Microbacterium aoyamense]|uniref:Integral membrane protein n=1 Tax=Microbacterium aoyamense TaxID=344166 RepID=A0ABN2PWI3_9MICO|nr:hypothetical protein [Microbacterium aoyamense]